MAVWIRQMRTVPFWSEEPSASHYGAINTAWPTYEGARIVSAYLRGFPSKPPVDAMLDGVVGHYDKIRELLHPAVTGQGGESYGQFMNDKAKQEAHAEQVLGPVATELSSAAQTIETVLAELKKG
jgi:hypothetical protein